MATAFLYGNAIVQAFGAGIDFENDDIRLALCTSTYAPDQDADVFFSDISNEVTGTGYTAGGAAVASAAVSYAAGVTTLTFDAVTWADSTITARYGVIYKKGATANASPLICWQDADADISSTAGDFVFTPDGGGVVTVTVAAPA